MIRIGFKVIVLDLINLSFSPFGLLLNVTQFAFLLVEN